MQRLGMVWTCESSWPEIRLVAPVAPKGDWTLLAERSDRFRALYQAEVVALLGYAARRIARPEDAADIVADVFTVAWRRIDDVPDGGEARLWLYGVARNVLSNHRRGARRQDRLTDRLRGELRLITPAVQPADDDVDAVRAALGRMSVDDRELLQLTAWECLSPNEVALAMGVPAGTVRSRLHRARRQLRRELERVGGDDERAAHAVDRSERCAPTGHVRGGERLLATEHEELR